MPRVSASDLLRAHTLVPPVEAQNRIVDLMGAVDAYVAAADARVEAARAARNALLSELLANPADDWTSVALGEAVRIRIGRTPPRNAPEYWTSDQVRPFCTIADMTGPVVEETREGITALAEEQGKAKRVPRGALLMSFKLSIGRLAIAGRDLFPNEAIAWLEPRSALLDTDFLMAALSVQDLTAASGRAVKGATLNSKSMAAIRIDLPPLGEQQRIVGIVASAEGFLSASEQAARSARSVRASLLTDLLSGAHEIPASYDRFLEAA